MACLTCELSFLSLVCEAAGETDQPGQPQLATPGHQVGTELACSVRSVTSLHLVDQRLTCGARQQARPHLQDQQSVWWGVIELQATAQPLLTLLRTEKLQVRYRQTQKDIDIHRQTPTSTGSEPASGMTAGWWSCERRVSWPAACREARRTSAASWPTLPTLTQATTRLDPSSPSSRAHRSCLSADEDICNNSWYQSWKNVKYNHSQIGKYE